MKSFLQAKSWNSQFIELYLIEILCFALNVCKYIFGYPFNLVDLLIGGNFEDCKVIVEIIGQK